MTIKRRSLVIETGDFAWRWVAGEIQARCVRISWAPGSVLDEMKALKAALEAALEKLRGKRE
jgi:hypothetical protein